MRARPAIAVVALLAGCGELDNDALREGVIRGKLTQTDGSALVVVFGQPKLTTTPSETGEFELREVPQGPVEVLAIASRVAASRLAVDVRGGQVADLGSVTLRPAGAIELELRAPSHQRLSHAVIVVQGTPFVPAFITNSGEAFIGPVPAGCYDVHADVPGLGSVDKQACVPEGVELEVSAALPAPDGTEGHEGCAVTGCDHDDLRCYSDGSCGY